MATATVDHHPELTKERALEVFERHFGDEYEVYETDGLIDKWHRDFIVEKSDWTGVWVKLKQKQNHTIFVFTAFIPNGWLEFLFGFGSLLAAGIPYFLAHVVLWPSRKAMEEEVRSFIENAPEFK